MDNDIDFKLAMADVRPLHPTKRAQRLPPAKIAQVQPQPLELSDNTAHFIGATENESGAKDLLFARGGIQGRQLRELKQSRHFHPQAIIDLHGSQLSKAERLLRTFIAQAKQRGTRHILIIHGKGLHTLGGHSSLKAFTADWLKHRPEVLAYVSAQIEDGGNGALYVLLKRQN